LVGIISQVVNCTADEVSEDAFLVTNLGLTSIGRLELVNALEQEFRLDLDDAQIGPQTRVADLRAMIARREKTATPRGMRLWAQSAPVRLMRRMLDGLLHYPLFRLFVTLQVSGLEHLRGIDGPVLFIANHTSYLDQPAIMFSLPQERRYRTATAAWAEFFFVNFHTPLQRLWKRFTFEYGTVGINLFPLPQTSGFRGALQHMGRLVDRGCSILVFPEGERTPTGRMLPFRNGLGIMAVELGIPVVPVAISGLEKVLPRDATRLRRGEVRVCFGPPLAVADNDVSRIVAQAERAVAGLLPMEQP
jgi:long-chain acyl-CoA synthetase